VENGELVLSIEYIVLRYMKLHLKFSAKSQTTDNRQQITDN